uniref:Uncharacterized protein n=1 Tax=Rhipicephalus microplus TaxID=6941 RepID=A0A6G5A9R5_RHIMP
MLSVSEDERKHQDIKILTVAGISIAWSPISQPTAHDRRCSISQPMKVVTKCSAYRYQYDKIITGANRFAATQLHFQRSWNAARLAEASKCASYTVRVQVAHLDW